MRPASLVAGTPTTGDWSEADRLLAIAYDVDRSALCECGCGGYRDETQNPDSEGWYEVDGDGRCWKRAALDAFTDQQKTRPHGQLLRVVDAHDEYGSVEGEDIAPVVTALDDIGEAVPLAGRVGE